MKKIVILTMVTLISMTNFAYAESTSDTKNAVSDMISGAITFGKETLSGIQEGVEDGRMKSESLDGAKLINSTKTLTQYDVALSIYKVKKLSDDSYEITMAIRNNEETPIRFINLSEPMKVLLLDDDGFASNLNSKKLDITVPAKSAIRESWKFSQVEGTPDILRVYDIEFKVPKAK